MILRALTFAGGITGAVLASQFPEYSQQYLQRLGGAVDALHEVTADFDASAQAVGMSRAEALAQMTGSPFMERRRMDMSATFTRYETLRDTLHKLEGQGPFMRAYYLPRMNDPQIAKAAWGAFQPAVPLGFAGAVFAGFGFVIGALGVGILLGVLAQPFKRRRHRTQLPSHD
ncbi:MAG: DUF2937 family protein [Sulfitobacter sp.]|jgi:DUF2937 family protein|uniref:DUF2937 family protein n=3 Tax=Sulfitobacter sp. TaxID=1903071 RepID=UPI000C0CCD9F|nr:hypothetical protein [Roseobacter sp.]MBV48316.1 hypothetical protein [Roseobacter sp.]PHR09618.1 MAG: hypothetical protein COB29_03510 [Sulfitobacter sp.]|tara:strand:+ start:35443 stop:35958 length:516 start_codon:yes stop_codon:yes gene_type:complete